MRGNNPRHGLLRLSLGLSLGLICQTGVAANEAAPNYPVDPETTLLVAPGYDVVKAHCTVCHSAMLFTQRGYTRKVWLEQIRWMQETQGLWEFTPEQEKTILDYLETYYPPK